MRIALCAEGPVEPTAAIEAYLARFPPTPADPLHLLFGMRRTPPPLPRPLPPGLTVGTFVPGRGLRGVTPLANERHSYSEICAALRSGDLSPDVVIACATTSDGAGMRSLGAIDGYLGLALENAPVVVEEVPWLPWIPGAAEVVGPELVVASRIGPDDAQPWFSAPHDEVDRTIARRIVDLLPERPRLALGIGRISEAVGEQLRDRDDVSIVTGVATTGTRHLAEHGALADGPAHAMSVVGPRDLLDWAVGHVSLHSSTLIHDPLTLARLPRFVSVLGAISIDRTGNVNSEWTSRGLVSGRGGAPDFAAGASLSAGGLSIVALHSRDPRGGSRLAEGIERPSTLGSCVDVVVTERGCAHIAGLEPGARAAEIERIF